MNQILAGSTILVLTIILWGLGKRPGIEVLRKRYKDVLNKTSTQTTLVEFQKGSQPHKKVIPSAFSVWKAPSSARERVNLHYQLNKSMSAGPEERLEAVSIAASWGHKCILPLLRRGLKDSDSRIVIIAAKALESHKCQPLKATVQLERPPRNVALIR